MTEFVAPRCKHGRIILGCPRDDCEEQNAYVADQNAKYDEWYRRATSLESLMEMGKSDDDVLGRASTASCGNWVVLPAVGGSVGGFGAVCGEAPRGTRP